MPCLWASESPAGPKNQSLPLCSSQKTVGRGSLRVSLFWDHWYNRIRWKKSLREVTTWKNWRDWQKHVSSKIKHTLPYDPGVTLLGIYPKELKTPVHIKTCTWGFRTALFINCQNLKAPKMSFSGWMGKIRYIQTMGYCSALTRNERWSQEKTWRHLHSILLNERSQPERLHTL